MNEILMKVLYIYLYNERCFFKHDDDEDTLVDFACLNDAFRVKKNAPIHKKSSYELKKILCARNKKRFHLNYE